MRLMNITVVKPLTGYEVHLQFDDGTERIVDLEPYLHGPIFEPVRDDTSFFHSVTVDQAAGTIVWTNGADIDPNVLYYDHLQPAWIEDQAQQPQSN
jgi:hypothetical protein